MKLDDPKGDDSGDGSNGSGWESGVPGVTVPGDANANGIPDIIEPAKRKFDDGKKQSSPTVLDLDGNGIQTTAKNSGLWFNHDGNGFAESTGWVGEGVGPLVLDLDGNGNFKFGELSSLEAAGVKSINLAYTNSDYIDDNSNAHKLVSAAVLIIVTLAYRKTAIT